jgi:hypothetical protein
MKAKDFWNILWNDFDYRFFSGVPAIELIPLYKSMDSSMMNYIPAANENIGLNLSVGSWIAGTKSGMLLPKNLFNHLDLTDLEFPVIFIVSGNAVVLKNIISMAVSEDELRKFISDTFISKAPGVILVKEGDLK